MMEYYRRSGGDVKKSSGQPRSSTPAVDKKIASGHERVDRDSRQPERFGNIFGCAIVFGARAFILATLLCQDNSVLAFKAYSSTYVVRPVRCRVLIAQAADSGSHDNLADAVWQG